MNFDAALAALLSQPWGEEACQGYMILTLERCGYRPATIARAIAELYEVLDFTAPQEAQSLLG